MVFLEKKDGIGYIILDRGERHNALNAAGYKELRDTIREVSEDKEILVSVLMARGKSFCAGSDINEFIRDDIIKLRAHFEVVSDVFKGISECKKLILAAIHGYALGGGCALAAACDFAIASEDAVFALPEVDINVFPMTIMPPIVRAVHYRQALELLFLGEHVKAQRALEMGLVNKVVSTNELLDTVEEMARKLCRISPFALETGKKAMQISQSMEYFTSIDYLSNMMAMVTIHKEAQEKFREFLSKKK